MLKTQNPDMAVIFNSHHAFVAITWHITTDETILQYDPKDKYWEKLVVIKNDAVLQNYGQRYGVYPRPDKPGLMSFKGLLTNGK